MSAEECLHEHVLCCVYPLSLSLSLPLFYSSSYTTYCKMLAPRPAMTLGRERLAFSWRLMDADRQGGSGLGVLEFRVRV